MTQRLGNRLYKLNRSKCEKPEYSMKWMGLMPQSMVHMHTGLETKVLRLNLIFKTRIRKVMPFNAKIIVPFPKNQIFTSHTTIIFRVDLTFHLRNPARLKRKKDIHSKELLSELVDGEENLGAHYHSLTADSFGVLSDVRTGGLKRDLSNAFANQADWNNQGFLEFDADNWSDDFSNYIYKQRIFYQKSVPYIGEQFDGPDNKPNTDDDIFVTKENDWRTGSDQTLLEEHTILAGPRWSVMVHFTITIC